ncbi:MAG: hypothetical protein BGN85_14300 [Alphaproteobacteria bacterium 64-11]|nr:chemotaxis response regulator protein-glutamate methylesterase [Alphaproteobacteria bacterium]OJU11143.1 MAG: hypothetical protein BGN85_14300 [Alphaproteobacteria bacterium 64-11]
MASRSPGRKIRVLIVDDCAAMRGLLRAVLSRDPGIEVVGEAPDPDAARALIRSLDPDVLTLDVEMRGTSGLELLEGLMRACPTPVVMISTLTARGTEVTLDALALGAVDCFARPTHNVAAHLDGAAQELIAKVRGAASAKVRPFMRAASVPSAPRCFDDRIIAVGASTGGVEAVAQLLSHFPANCPPTLVALHMPAGFTASFAARLDRLCAPHVDQAVDGAPLTPGQVWLVPDGGAHLEVGGRTNPRCRLTDGPVGGHRGSVDRMFHSLARHCARKAVGVILTGTGRDGADGLGALASAGGQTVGQDEASSVVYGMPRAAFETGAVLHQLPLEKIGPFVLDLCLSLPPAEQMQDCHANEEAKATA